jgi:hypothetical protein
VKQKSLPLPPSAGNSLPTDISSYSGTLESFKVFFILLQFLAIFVILFDCVRAKDT